ncbi:uncharacterized protein JCM15063_005054 [Sporobolomyces koalae]|uniref:uncharacterized protein n=1 Tax=Sporobolomyces koalae TaxID=500713 RepID=UPI00317981D6
MSGRVSRPRRSAPTSYTHLLKPIELTSSSSSDNDSDSDSTKRKKLLKKKKTNFIPSGESESEFEAPTPNGGNNGEHGGGDDDDESDDFDDGAGVSTDDAQASGQGEEDMSDIAMSSGEMDPGSPGPSRKRLTKKARVADASTAQPERKKSVVVTRAALPAEAADASASEGPARATPPGVISSALDGQYASLVPHYLPPHVFLDPSSSSSFSTARVETSTHTGKGQFDGDASTLAERWTANPFAPERALVRDVGWHKGKWTADGIKDRWGGWYDNITLEPRDLRSVSRESIEARLPTQVYHARPIPFHTLTVTEPKADPTGAAMLGETTDDTLPAGITQQAAESIDTDGSRQVLVGRGLAEQGEHEINLERFASVPLQYLAVGTICSPSLTLSHPPNLSGSRSTSLVQIWSMHDPEPSKTLAVEVSDDSDGQEATRGGMRLELGLLVGENEGEARDLQWCPKGGTCSEDDPMNTDALESLGILAGVFTDGTIKMFAVPRPDAVRTEQGINGDEPVYIHAKKVLELKIPNSACLSFAWGSWETVAAGCLNGYVAVWSVGDALRNGSPSAVRPTQWIPAHSCAIRAITFLNSPPPSTDSDNSGAFDLDGDPHKLGTVGYDGSTHVTDLRETGFAGVGVVLHERSSTFAVAWCPQSGCLYADDQEDRIRAYFTKAQEFGGSKRIGAHRGTVWSIATSEHHPFVLSSSSDGSVQMYSGVRALRKRRVKGHFMQRIYSLDFDRETGKWRMKDNFQVEHRTALDSVPPGIKAKKTAEAAVNSIVTWPQEVQLNKVCWHPNLERSALVASGGNWGCVRIDWLEGIGER